MDLKIARNEALHERVTALEIEIDVMKADKIVLETQIAEQRVAAYALKQEERDRKLSSVERAVKVVERDQKRTEKEAEEVVKAAERHFNCTFLEAEELALEHRRQERHRKRAENEAEEAAKTAEHDRECTEKASGIIKPYVQRVARTWTTELDEIITRMRADSISFANIASRLGNGLKKNDIKNRWKRHLKT